MCKTMGKITLLTLMTLFLGACVPNKKIVYLQQGKELKNKNEILKDSVLRTREMNIVEYKIQPLDILSINFESITSEEYDFFSKISPENNITGNNIVLRGVMVDVDGNVEYPVVGKVNLKGLTLFEAQQKMQQVANQYLKDAVVRIRLLNFRFTILGEVNDEKVVNSTNPRVSMMEAIGLAGGFGELADRSTVKVVRQKGNSSEIFYINLLEEKYLESSYYFVQQNDLIIVSPLKQRAFKQYFGPNLALWTSTLSAILILITTLK